MKVLWLGLWMSLSFALEAKIVSRTVQYMDQDRELKGTLYFDNKLKKEDKRPGILVYPGRWGADGIILRHARRLAQQGYITFVADVYGQGIVTSRDSRARKLTRIVTKDPIWWMSRTGAALDQLLGVPWVDAGRVAAIGYAVGASSVMKMAYSGFPFRAVVAFYPDFNTLPVSGDACIKTEILVFHGEADANVKPEQVQKFKRALQRFKAEWTFIGYPGVTQGFTNSSAGKYRLANYKYNKAASEDAWRRMQDFFKRVLANP